MAQLRSQMGKPPVSSRSATCGPRADRGFALISVLWVLVLLTAIVGEFAYSMRTEVHITQNFKEATQAHFIAHSGLMRSVVEVLRTTAQSNAENDAYEIDQGGIWRVNVPIPAQGYGTGEFTVHIDNSAGLVDLNTANEGLLKILVSTLATSDQNKAVIVDSILDWRDSDDFHRVNGAEDTYYQALVSPYDCKNAPFASAVELLLVRGITPELYWSQLESVVTVIPDGNADRNGQSGSSPGATRMESVGQININAAPPELLKALPQITAEQVWSLVEFRKYNDFESMEEIRGLLGAEVLSAISPYITLELSPYYFIHAEGRVTGSSVRQTIQALVQIDETLPLGYETVRWQEQYY